MKKQLVIPSVERGTWVGGDTQDEPPAEQAHIPIRDLAVSQHAEF
jgi:hypothetical protein